MAEEVPRTTKSLKNLSVKRASSSLKDQNPMKKQRKGKNIVIDPPSPHVKICRNAACKATLSSELKFCKRCSCYICKHFDDNKEPSKWLECSSGLEDSCGFSCHLECALEERIENGSYSCARCGRVSSIIGCWKKLLIKAKDCRRIKEFCDMIFLSYKLLNGSSKYKELHQLIEEAKGHIEVELNSPIYNPKDTYKLVGLLSSAEKVKCLLSVAIEDADKLLSVNSILIPIHGAERQDLTVTELGSESALKVHNMIDLNNPPVSDVNEVIYEFDSSKKSGLGDDFEKIVKTICYLEREDYISETFRKKFLTWFSLKAGDQERRIVSAFQQALADTPTHLADQLKDTFSKVIFNQSA